jgi:hypothetical protein
MIADPVNGIDPLGLYGTNDCYYYESRCDESGGEYYCKTAPKWCQRFPKYPDPDPSRDDDFEGWSRCTRQCLQDCDFIINRDRNQNMCFEEPATDSFWDFGNFACHENCYVGCSGNATFR